MADENNTSNNSSENQRSTDAGNTGNGGNPVVAHLLAHKVESVLWLTRLFTVVSSICFLLPIFGGNPYSFYQRALIATAATSALRLHMRVTNVQLNMEFLRRLFVEDSSHYLMYCILFINSYPMTMALIPVFLFALLHACSYTKTLLNLKGPNSLMFVRNMISKVEAQQMNILRFIASTEILLMPTIIILVFSGKSSFFLPFVYYRFLCLRYASRRNPYNRTIFNEFRMVTEYLCAKPQCPGFVRSICHSAINLIVRLAPPAEAQAQ